MTATDHGSPAAHDPCGSPSHGARLLPNTVRAAERCRTDLASLELQLRALSPQATLDRGYALVTDEQGLLVRTPPAARTLVHVRVQSGGFSAVTGEGSSDDE